MELSHLVHVPWDGKGSQSIKHVPLLYHNTLKSSSYSTPSEVKYLKHPKEKIANINGILWWYHNLCLPCGDVNVTGNKCSFSDYKHCWPSTDWAQNWINKLCKKSSSIVVA